MFDLKLTKKRLAMHWDYYRFKYLIVIVAAIAMVSLLNASTEPKTPADRKVDVVMLSSGYSNDYVEALQQELLCALPPDQKEVNLTVMPNVEGQDIHMVLAARMAAREGDIWILPSDFYRSFAQSGAFIALDDLLPSLGLPEGFDPSAARVIVQPDEDTPGEQHVCGIPLDSFEGLSAYFLPDGMVLAFPSAYAANLDNAKLVASRFFSMTELNIQSLTAQGGSFGFYIATQFIDETAASAWRPAIQEKVKFAPEVLGVHAVPYQLGREGDVAKLLASRMPNYSSGMIMVRREVFTLLARQGALAPLDDAARLLGLPDGLDLSAGRASAVDKQGAAGPEQLYGIPLDEFSGLTRAFNPRGMVLAFPVQQGEALSAAIDAAKVVLEIKD